MTPATWLALDNWCLRVGVTGRDCHWWARQRLARQAEALKAEYRRHTPEGFREWDAASKRLLQAMSDKRFQSFKALVPGLVPPKRGRKPRAQAATEATSQAAPQALQCAAGKAGDMGEAPPLR